MCGFVFVVVPTFSIILLMYGYNYVGKYHGCLVWKGNWGAESKGFWLARDLH